MPAELEKKLKSEAKKKGLKGERANAYIYGTMQKVTDWKPGKKKHSTKSKALVNIIKGK